MDFLLILLSALLVPFVLPIASWVSARRTRSRVVELEAALAEQQSALDRLTKRVAELYREGRPSEASAGAAPSAKPAPQKPVVTPPAPAPSPATAAPPAASLPSVPVTPVAPPPATTPAPSVERPRPDQPPRPRVEPPPRPPTVERPAATPQRPVLSDARRRASRRAHAATAARATATTGAAVRASGARVRLGKPGRGQALLGHRRHRAGVRRGVLSSLLRATGMASASRARPHRDHRRDHAAGASAS